MGRSASKREADVVTQHTFQTDSARSSMRSDTDERRERGVRAEVGCNIDIHAAESSLQSVVRVKDDQGRGARRGGTQAHRCPCCECDARNTCQAHATLTHSTSRWRGGEEQGYKAKPKPHHALCTQSESDEHSRGGTPARRRGSNHKRSKGVRATPHQQSVPRGRGNAVLVLMLCTSELFSRQHSVAA